MNLDDPKTTAGAAEWAWRTPESGRHELWHRAVGGVLVIVQLTGGRLRWRWQSRFGDQPGTRRMMHRLPTDETALDVLKSRLLKRAKARLDG